VVALHEEVETNSNYPPFNPFPGSACNEFEFTEPVLKRYCVSLLSPKVISIPPDDSPEVR
jgi:hypothetical protein